VPNVQQHQNEQSMAKLNEMFEKWSKTVVSCI